MEPLANRICEIVPGSTLESLISKFASVSDTEFALVIAQDPPLTIGSAECETAAGVVTATLEVQGEEVGVIYGHSQGHSAEKVEAAVNMLKEMLESSISHEMEMESLSMEVANNYQEIHYIMENNTLFAEALEIDALSKITLERALMMSNASIATIMLYDKEKDHLTLLGRDGGRAGATDTGPVPLAGSLWENVVRELQPLLIEDVTKADELDPEIYRAMDFGSFATACFLSVPLKVKDEAIGVLNVGDKTTGMFTSSDMKSLGGLAAQSASSIEKARLYKNVEKEAKLRSNFQRYLSPTIVDDIINNRADITLGGEVIECSILFSDICKFTTISEKEKPEVILATLNDYFSVMTEIIFRHKGTLDKFIGDAIMAVFGAPMFSPDSHKQAVLAAMEMHQALGVLTRKWEAEGKPIFRQRIGINTGLVVAGNIGSPDRMDYTVIGDVVNTAARMEANARPMTTLISDNTYQKVKDMVKVRALEPILVKGKTISLLTYEVLAMKPLATGPSEALRKFPRLGLSNATTVRDAGGTYTYEGTTLNLSSGGTLLALPVELEAGCRVNVDMSLDGGASTTTMCGKVAYRKKLKDNVGTVYYHTGIEFSDMLEEHRRALLAFIES